MMNESSTSNRKMLISEARDSFNRVLKTPQYRTVISDDDQCKRLIELLRVQPQGTYLDLATGTGYVGFAIAERHPSSSVRGIDIADEIIAENLRRAEEQSLSNIDFSVFNGMTFPAFSIRFDGVICRYALHHFPDVDSILEEINKVLKRSGRVVISDAIRNEHDHEDFINRFQGLKRDGHVRMYTRREMVSLFQRHDFTEAESFGTRITFSCKWNPQYRDLLDEISSETKEQYAVVVGKNEVTLSFDILNISFAKS